MKLNIIQLETVKEVLIEFRGDLQLSKLQVFFYFSVPVQLI